ncbi:hypothetical protein Q5P01_012637 [Channa striata]|uniref:C2 domain-containing protein n=1 Tax=Channa striata TaxID=64152 RepID=A0AA88SLT8_CHASR|nr:hypothetical protein Q5P01_012637 [Channa striata]
MPYHDEEYPGQPLWQSVLLFCCKGMIEGIMVILFSWLLVQVLFTKHLEVHLQILLLVGLIVFCLSLMLGCILCWRKSHICPVWDKEAVTLSAAPPEPVTLDRSPSPSATTPACRQQYEELDGDLLDYPSTFTSPGPSEMAFTSQTFSNQACVASEQKEQPKFNFSLRRLSTPLLTSTLYKPIDASHDSVLTFPKAGLFSKACRPLQRRCTVTGDSLSYNERSRLTSSSAASCSMREETVPLTPLSYGSSSRCKQVTSPKPCLHFTMAFSPGQQTLTVTVLSLSGTAYTLEDVFVLGSLIPLYPCPIQASVQSSLGRECHSPVVLLKSLITSDAPVHRGLNCPPQIFILLQYQTQTHRIKATVLRVDNLDSLVHASAAGYKVVINLHYDGAVISSRETEGGPCTVWNTSFLFDLPAGNISQLPLMLEFIIMQNQVLSECKVLGRVLIGAAAADAGRAHWRDMCILQVEQARWHTLQPEPL